MQRRKLKSVVTKVNKLSLHARIYNDNKNTDTPIILVHGLAVSSRYMIPTAELLSNTYNVYAIDLPGFGESQNPPHVFSTDEHADIIAQWMKAMHIPKAVLLGNSLGCQIIVDVARKYPKIVSRLVLAGPTMDPQTKSLFLQFIRLVINLTREPISYIPLLIRDFFNAGMWRTLQTARLGMRDPMKTQLTQVTVPTLVIRGEHDTIVPQRWAEEVVQQLPKGRLKVIPNAAHVINYNSPDALVKEVKDFLRNS